MNQQFEIRYRQFKRGRRSERTMKVTAKTKAHAKRLFRAGMPGSLVHVISVNQVKEA